MSDLSPGSAPAAPETTVTVTSDFSESDAADAILKGLLADNGDVAPSQDSADEADTGAQETAPTGEEEGHSEPPEERPATIEPPKSWSDEDKAEFGKLPPSVQRTLAQRESERDRAFNQKAEEIANHRKAADAAREEATKATADYQQNLRTLAQYALPQLARFEQLKDVNWVRQNPADAVVLDAERKAFEAQIGAIQAEIQRVDQARQQENVQKQKEYLLSQQTLLNERAPVFADETKAPAARQELTQFLVQHGGFSLQEVGGFTDARGLAMAYELMCLRQAEAARKTAEATRKAAEAKTVASQAPRVMAPGNAPDNPKDALTQRQREKVQRYFDPRGGNTDRDAADLIFESMFR